MTEEACRAAVGRISVRGFGGEALSVAPLIIPVRPILMNVLLILVPRLIFSWIGYKSIGRMSMMMMFESTVEATTEFERVCITALLVAEFWIAKSWSRNELVSMTSLKVSTSILLSRSRTN